MRVPFRLVDVFTERPFAGNQLWIVTQPPPGLDSAAMQTLAKEIGFSETTFVTEAGGDRYAMRIFTPERELPFAGHPTLGTALTLLDEGRIGSPAVQTTTVGQVPVEADLATGFVWMTQRPPEFGPEFADRRLLAAAAGIAEGDLRPDLPRSGGLDRSQAARSLTGMPGRTIIAQGELVGRPSFLHVDARQDGDSWTVRVGGGVRLVGEGSFEV